MYEKTFDENCAYWSRNTAHNMMFIMSNVNYANNRLRILGWISLNEVYDLLGFPRELEAQVIGWKFTGEKDNECVEIEAIEEQGSSVKIIFKNIVKLL